VNAVTASFNTTVGQPAEMSQRKKTASKRWPRLYLRSQFAFCGHGAVGSCLHIRVGDILCAPLELFTRALSDRQLARFAMSSNDLAAQLTPRRMYARSRSIALVGILLHLRPYRLLCCCPADNNETQTSPAGLAYSAVAAVVRS